MSGFYPPLAEPSSSASSLSAPVLVNSGHDFVRLSWPRTDPSAEGNTTFRLEQSRWTFDYVQHFPPDVTGAYATNESLLSVCSLSTLSSGRLITVARSHGNESEWIGLAAARWDVQQGGYAGLALSSNPNMTSGPFLWYPHSYNGTLRMLSSALEVGDETEVYREVYREDALPLEMPEGALAQATAAACSMIDRLTPPAVTEGLMPAAASPALTGRYSSDFNETLEVCSRNGSLVATFSGLGALHGFALAGWVPSRSRWEGSAVEIGTLGIGTLAQDFSWEIAPENGALYGDWSLYNRTWLTPESVNLSVPWAARPIEPTDPEYVDPNDLIDGDLCRLLSALASGAVEEDPPAFFEHPRFPLLVEPCANLSANLSANVSANVSNATDANATLCTREDPNATYDLDGYFRRAPARDVYTWSAAKEVTPVSNGTAEAHQSVVVADLLLDEWYSYRVVHLQPQPPPMPPPPPRTSRVRDPAAIAMTALLEEHAPERLPPPAPSSMPLPPLQIAQTNYSRPHHVVPSGPGAPESLHLDRVSSNSLVLHWSAPRGDAAGGIWHGSGGRPLIGYRIFARIEGEPIDAARIVHSTTQVHATVRHLPPQTRLVLFVAAENEEHRGLNSSQVAVATASLRVELHSLCGFQDAYVRPFEYQGCFGEPGPRLATSNASAIEALSKGPSELQQAPGDAFSWTLTLEACAHRCTHFDFFGMRAGGRCGCGDTFGRHGSVDDARCNVPCSGEPGRDCGGAEHLSVYRQAGPRGVLLGVGEYTAFDLTKFGVGARELSSLRIPAGLVVTLFNRDHFQGMSVELGAGEITCLRQFSCDDEPSSDTPEPQSEPSSERRAACSGHHWDDETSSLRIEYTGLRPPYRPVQSTETGARAFALAELGVLRRQYELGLRQLGDLGSADVPLMLSLDGRELSASELADAERRGEPVTAAWRAPREGDEEECASWRGGYSADRVCLQPRLTAPEADQVLPHMYTVYQQQEELRRKEIEQYEHILREEDMRLDMEQKLESLNTAQEFPQPSERLGSRGEPFFGGHFR